MGTADDMVDVNNKSKSDKKETVMDKKIKHKPRGPPRALPQPGIKDDLTVIAHICLGIYVIIICYLCFANPFTFFTWHPLLLSIGVSYSNITFAF